MNKAEARSEILDGVHAIENGKETPSLQACESQLCTVEFRPTCLPWSYQRFCSDACKQQASLIRRAARLLDGLPDEAVLKIIRKASGR
jgi:hypothetical protein